LPLAPCDAPLTHATQVKTLAEEIGVAFLGLGFQPKWSVADTPAMPKARRPSRCAARRI
jgi:glutamate--cysteine ligase